MSEPNYDITDANLYTCECLIVELQKQKKALLAACEAFAASMDRPCASLQGLRDALVTPHALARGAIELAKKEPTDE